MSRTVATELLPLLLTAGQAAELLGIAEPTFNEKLRNGDIPDWVRHRTTANQSKCRRYSRFQLERWAAGETGAQS